MQAFFQSATLGPRYLLIDEAQRTYDYEDTKSTWLWDVALKTLLQAGFPETYLVLFSAYGSSRRDTTAGTTHVIPKDRIVSLKAQEDPTDIDMPGLLLTSAEIEELLASYKSIVTFDIEFMVVKQGVYDIDAPFLGKVSRGLPKHLDRLTQAELEHLDRVALHKFLPVSAALRQQLERIIRLGYIQEEGDVYTFASPLKEWVYICNRWMSPVRRPRTTIINFLESIIRRLSPDILLNSLSRDEKGHLYKRQFQMEFYRVGSDILGTDYFFSPLPRFEGIPIQREGDDDGWIDFIADSSLGWGIELLRDGDRMMRHARRFEVGGAYFEMIRSGFIQEWVIVDLRLPDSRGKVKELRARKENFIHVVFSNDFRKATIKQQGVGDKEVILMGDADADVIASISASLKNVDISPS
ncbi:hypothetical protein HK097_004193 [Rhizophlyctis rosea]|uniref:Uncharacterized protein n=1 Tax=Rhizophlyctis rosea TaxID=64517 RepID=A0AAD5X3M0_9FUNG|nr:hypothetical protein HK097_004193 [Rhizophlyctis rosea]